MPRQNRVWPTGDIVADPARGLFMGNRGCLHDAAGNLGRARWRHRAWITCVTSFKGRQRALMAPGRYTELFFMDEAVACAAGHRPCAECRRSDWLAFTACWAACFGPMRAADIDRMLHMSRVDGTAPRRHMALARDLPDGAMAMIADAPHLIFAQRARRWWPDGYDKPDPLPEGHVEVLTPAPMVAVMRAGWRPMLHPTALSVERDA